MTDPAAGAARYLVERLGRPRLGVVLGSGFAPLLDALEPQDRVSTDEIADYPAVGTAGHRGLIAAVYRCGQVVWVFGGRPHLYEGRSVEEVVLPVRVLARAGASGVLLSCACGGLAEQDRPGHLVLIRDHLNLTGADPVRRLPSPEQRPVFLDLQHAYDEVWIERWLDVAHAHDVPLRQAVLAAMPGPSYETPAEVRMLRTMGADVVSMSTVPEVIAARYLGLRVAVVACVANRGAGLSSGADSIRHVDVLDVVADAVRRSARFLVDGLDAMLGAASQGDRPTASR